MLWTAPELLRSKENNFKGTQKGILLNEYSICLTNFMQHIQ